MMVKAKLWEMELVDGAYDSADGVSEQGARRGGEIGREGDGVRVIAFP